MKTSSNNKERKTMILICFSITRMKRSRFLFFGRTIYIYIYIYLFAGVTIHLHIYKYIIHIINICNVYICVYIHIYVCVYRYVCTYVYIYIHKEPLRMSAPNASLDEGEYFSMGRVTGISCYWNICICICMCIYI